MTHATPTDKTTPYQTAGFMAHGHLSDAVEIPTYEHNGIRHNSTRKVDIFVTSLLNTVLVQTSQTL
jgi:hypothetical protein